VRRGRAAVVGLVALLDQVAVEVVGGLDDVARILDEGRRGAVVRHELREALALVVDVHDVRPREGRAGLRVHDERVRVPAADLAAPPVQGPVGLALEDEADRVVIKKIGAHAVGHADEHVARVRVDLADGGQDLQGAVRVVRVARLAVDGAERLALAARADAVLRVGGLREVRRVRADGLGAGRRRRVDAVREAHERVVPAGDRGGRGGGAALG
jgi:hypothetical protein